MVGEDRDKRQTKRKELFKVDVSMCDLHLHMTSTKPLGNTSVSSSRSTADVTSCRRDILTQVQ